jgi:NADH-quinone oxidoreductase subunit E
VNELITHYPVKRAASLMVLHAIQEKFGWISQPRRFCGRRRSWNCSRSTSFEILTFYPMLRQEPMGKYQIKVCRTLSCALGGAYELREHFCKKLGWTRTRTARRRRRTESSRSNSSSASPVAAPRR